MKQLFSGEAQEWVIQSAESDGHRQWGKTDMYNAVMGRGLHGISSHIGVLMRGPGAME